MLSADRTSSSAYAYVIKYTGFFPNPEIASSFLPMAYSLWPIQYRCIS
ncbi:hypothetical protein [Moorena sp. SIO3B2]|nr:hypothetical protein [Moorena sp. SIO3B2]